MLIINITNPSCVQSRFNFIKVKEYMIPNYIGESLAALLPAILSLVQGLGQNPGCRNVTDPTTNLTTLEPIPITPNYSVSVYFMLLFCMLSISTISFTMLNFCNVSKRTRISNSNSFKTENKIKPIEKFSNSSDEFEISDSTLNGSKEKILTHENFSESSTNTEMIKNSQCIDEKNEKIILLSIILLISFICYGILPG